MRKLSKSLLFVLLSSLLAGPAFAFDRDHNPPGPRGGPGASPDRC